MELGAKLGPTPDWQFHSERLAIVNVSTAEQWTGAGQNW